MNRRLFLLTGSSLGAPLAARVPDRSETVYRFAAGGYDIRMNVEYFDAYASKGFWFKDQLSNNRFCLSWHSEENRNCPPNFFGSLAIARYHIRPCCKQTNLVALREYVRTIDQDNRLAVRAPFEYSIRAEDGVASDIQAFGYHLDVLSPPRQSAPAPNGPWCFVRQDLYLGPGALPFLVVHWKHTLSAIRLLDVIPGDQTRLLSQPERR